MATREKIYTRLTGRVSSSMFVRALTSLWLGADHLLLLESSGYTESYKRFYFRDIQALLLRKTRWGAIGNLALGIIALLFGLAAADETDDVGRVVLWFLCGFFALAVMINTLLGPTCTCYLQTAVQTQHLPSLRRLRAARKALGRLKPLVDAAQGEMPREVLRAQLAEIAARPPVIIAGSPAASTVVPPPVFIPHYHGRFHMILFILLLVDAALSMLLFVVPPESLQALNALMTAAVLGCVIGAIIKQGGSDMPRNLRWMVWGTLWIYLALQTVAFIYGIVVGARGDQFSIEDPVFLALIIVSLGFSLLMGTFGLRALIQFRQEHDSAAPPPLDLPPPAPQ